MADIIQLLPDHVANQIAAGEVVQRPASVVKELLENAIDAKATSITLVLKDAGKTLIQVIDNGVGMSVTDARLSFERHATSKIKAAEDLFNLHTKGFRGEALASIAAIAHVSLKTKIASDELGTQIEIEGSNVIKQDPIVTGKGTTISVKNLFYNIPARRNFLKSNPVETRHIIDEFHRVALAHPQVSFKMIHNDSIDFNLPIANSRQRIVGIFGTKTNEKLVPVEEETEILKVSGFVVKPEFARKSRGEQFFFVNNRFIKSGYLNHAVSTAFSGLIKDGMYPGYFLFLEVNPTSIDINIHPTKTEIKFDDEHAIYAMLRATIKHSLGQFSIVPVIDFNKETSLETPYAYSKKQPVAPTIEVDKEFNPFKTELKNTTSRLNYKKEQQSWESLYTGISESTITPQEHFESDPLPQKLFEDEDTKAGSFTFQLQNKYIISPIKSGMLVIHQNRAHQRILYEEILSNITIKEAVSQQLLFPLVLHFSDSDLQILKKIKEQLEHTGFLFSQEKEGTIEIIGVPIIVLESNVGHILEQLIADIKEEVPDAGFSQNDLLAQSMAKTMAVATGVSLTQEQQEHMVHQLFSCKEPSVSPTNKQVLITMTTSDFDKKF